jgi:hypothetical protein
MMNILKGIGDFLSGGLFKEIKETAMAYFPPDLSPEQKRQFELSMEQMLEAKQARIDKMLLEASQQLDKRIAEQEGTASDLKSLPIIGRMVLFLRGLQRPVWGFATLWMDFKWLFSTGTFTDQQNTALIIINILVLGFLFGERTIKNLEPLIVKVFAK